MKPPVPGPQVASEESRLAPLEPFGRALLDYHSGHSDALLLVKHSLDGLTELPVEVFFRGREGFFDFELAALAECRGSVLDIGAGSGLHCLELQNRGFEVTGMDVVPQAVQVMRERGVKHAILGSAFNAPLPVSDTILLLMNGTGLAGTLAGLEQLLLKLEEGVARGGQVLIDSTDPGLDRSGEGYPGEARIELAYEGQWGESYGELYCDLETLQKLAHRTGWASQAVFVEGDGTFLARLFR